ncbi:hypothetical protein BAZ12_18685 [Elizabethkingia miricola]|uniref:Uncharacterized protein n=1 Tax=Elizabethkingia miricola TaxID=172045 RepID=A0ABD4DJ44_ELIMR|nr:hypothetical protein [Elizabethkingia miricola]KUY17151.1 hypothetical protein ATB95_12285 [Elizabethkingia miricola]OPC72302.1 hypothetical protein BAZ13_06255 [Elizabethkingia miricola]OPC76043.1 hypothetical protein BAZ12_18685 [Elizabethkingia miricola]SPW31940.1 Uncharacterised protein [Elizabethkingia miricola]
MPKYERIKTHLLDLAPLSVSKVFEFLDLLYRNNLDKNYFIEHFKQYTIQEQYFICYYAKIYFGESENSFLNIELENIFRLYGNEIDSKIRSIKFNAISLLKYIDDTKFKTLERRVKLIKKRKIGFEKHMSHPKISTLRFRLPLYSFPTKITYEENPEFVGSFYSEEEKEYALLTGKEMSVTAPSEYFEKFKDSFFTTFNKEFDYEQIWMLFLNSFSFASNTTDIELLDLEFDNSTTMHRLFFETYKKYNGIQSELIQHMEKQKNAIKDLKKKRRKFSIKIRTYFATKKDFMKIMYNAFPQIRESYSSFKKKNPKTTLDQYLTTKSRNIK